MGYQLPTLQDLIKTAKTLGEDYEDRSNPERTSFLELLKNFAVYLESSQSDAAFALYADPTKPKAVENAKRKVLLGLFSLTLESIYSSYHYLNPERSRLYKIIRGKLNITSQNSLSDEETLVYVFKYFDFIKSNSTDSHMRIVNKLYWQSPEKFIAMTKKMLGGIKKRVDDQIRKIEEKPPVLASLRNNIGELSKKYEDATRNRYFANQSRIKLARVFDLVNESCEYYFSSMMKQCAESPEVCQFETKKIENTYMGIGVYAALKIYKEYSWLSPERSELYRLSSFAINKKDISKTDFDDKITYLRALAEHIKLIQSDKTYYAQFNDKWVAAGLKDMTTFLKDVEALIAEQEIQKAAPSTAMTVISTGTSYGVQYGLGIAAANVGFNYVLPSVATLAGGPVGLAVYAGGALLTTVIARFVAGNVLTRVTAGLYSWVLDKIGTAIGNATASVVVSATKGGLRVLMSNPNLKQEDRDFIEDFIQTLLMLPDDMMPKAEKDQIRNVMGIGLENTQSHRNTAAIAL